MTSDQAPDNQVFAKWLTTHLAELRADLEAKERLGELDQLEADILRDFRAADLARHQPLAGEPGDFTLHFRLPPTEHRDPALHSALRRGSR